MAVQNQTPVASFTTSGVTTVFPFAFMLLDADDLVVTLDGVTVSSGFSIAGIGAPAGGSVVFTTAPSPGQLLVLRRNIALQRLNDYQRNGDLLAQVLNLDLDRIWQALQGLRLDATRALKLPEDTLTDQTITDDAAGRAGKLVGFDGSGNVTVVEVSTPGALLVSAFIETLLPSANAAAARAVMGAVGTSGTDTIAGAKAFTSPVTIADGVDPEHAASVGQLADESAARDAAISAALALALLPQTLGPTLFVETTPKALTGLAAVEWTGLPSWARQFVIVISGQSGSTTGVAAVRIGTGGAAETAGYGGAAAVVFGSTAGANNSTFWRLTESAAAASAHSHTVTIGKGSGNAWTYAATGALDGGGGVVFGGGSKTLAGVLDMVQLIMTAGTFDGGTATLYYR